MTMATREQDVTRIIAKAAETFTHNAWDRRYYQHMAESIILALFQAGYVIAKDDTQKTKGDA